LQQVKDGRESGKANKGAVHDSRSSLQGSASLMGTPRGGQSIQAKLRVAIVP